MAKAFATKTYKVDLENDRIIGTIDEAQAYWQFCHKALSTDKEYWNYYNQNYGIRNMQRYIGKDIGYVEAHFPKDVNECLGTDFRTIRVDNFEYEEVMTDKGLGLKCSCVIWSIYGSKPYETTIQI